MDFSALPAHELIRDGLRDLAGGHETAEALLVLIGADRLRRAGIDVPQVHADDPEHQLYALLASDDPDTAHSRYNALIRQLVSFERAAERAASSIATGSSAS